MVVLLSVIIVGGSFWFGYQFGKEKVQVITLPNELAKHEVGKQEGIDFGIFWQTWQSLKDHYVDEKRLNPQEMVWGAIEGMVKAVGDPYTIFLPPQESKRFADDISGSFGGIGAEIGIRNDILTIISPLEGSPAQKAGLMAGDKILQISGTSTQDMSIDEAVNHIRGPKGSEVELLILRKDQEKPFSKKVVRDEIVIPTVKTELRDGVFIIHLYNFNQKAAWEFRKSLLKGISSGSKKLVIDVRNNPGGYLEVAVDIASWFLPKNSLVAKEDFGNGRADEFLSRGYDGVSDWKVVMLVNGGSASASEILAGALRDQKQVKLIGEKTFGKGSVQEVVNLPEGASLKVTIAKWLTPSGKSISDEGLVPDVEVKITQEDLDKGRDTQLEKAIEMLR